MNKMKSIVFSIPVKIKYDSNIPLNKLVQYISEQYKQGVCEQYTSDGVISIHSIKPNKREIKEILENYL